MHVLAHTYSTGVDDCDYSCLIPFIITKCCWTSTTEAENFHVSYFYQTDFLGLIIFTKISMIFNTRSGKILAVQLKELSDCWEEEKYPTVSNWKVKYDAKPLCQCVVFMKINVNLLMLEASKHFSLQQLNRPTQRIISRDCACSNPRLRDKVIQAR